MGLWWRLRLPLLYLYLGPQRLQLKALATRPSQPSHEHRSVYVCGLEALRALGHQADPKAKPHPAVQRQQAHGKDRAPAHQGPPWQRLRELISPAPPAPWLMMS